MFRSGELREVAHTYDLTEYRKHRDYSLHLYRPESGIAWLETVCPDVRPYDYLILPEGIFFVAGVYEKWIPINSFRARVYRIANQQSSRVPPVTMTVQPVRREPRYD